MPHSMDNTTVLEPGEVGAAWNVMAAGKLLLLAPAASDNVVQVCLQSAIPSYCTSMCSDDIGSLLGRNAHVEMVAQTGGCTCAH